MTKPFFIRKGQHWVARFAGDNGDLVVGCVESVRANGSVVLRNMLTNSVSTKDRDVLIARNKYVNRFNAESVVAHYRGSLASGKKPTQARREARKYAVGLPEMGSGKVSKAPPAQLPIQFPPAITLDPYMANKAAQLAVFQVIKSAASVLIQGESNFLVSSKTMSSIKLIQDLANKAFQELDAWDGHSG
jgi:hypothetical protein